MTLTKIRLNQIWFKDLNETEKKRRITLVSNSKRILSTLIEITEKLSKETLVPSTEKDYEHPGWALQQAHKEGYRRALFDLKNIMEIKTND